VECDEDMPRLMIGRTNYITIGHGRNNCGAALEVDGRLPAQGRSTRASPSVPVQACLNAGSTGLNA